MLFVGTDIAIFLLKRMRYLKHAKELRFLQVKMPRVDSDKDRSDDSIQSMKQNAEIMTQIYKNFYSIYSSKLLDRYFGEPYISCELIV